MTAPYTRRQGQYLGFIATYTRLQGRPPSEADIAAHFRVSPPSAHQMVITLEQRGLISRTPGQARSLRVLLPPTTILDIESGRTPQWEGPTIEETFPHLARWIESDGWVELGRTKYSMSMARVLDIGGMIWEGKDSYASLGELLQDLETAIAHAIADLGPALKESERE